MTHQAVPTRFTGAKSTSLVREVFTSNLWMSGLAMLKYIPRSFGVKQVLKPPAIQDLTSANPDPDMPPLTKEDEDDVTDRKLAAIHFANIKKGKPSS